jgi:hypothetical protein
MTFSGPTPPCRCLSLATSALVRWRDERQVGPEHTAVAVELLLKRTGDDDVRV